MDLTDKEIMEKANFKSLSYNTKYSEDSEFSDMLENPQRYQKEAILNIANMLRKKAWRDGYEDGAKENAPKWHYPSKGEYPPLKELPEGGSYNPPVLVFWWGSDFGHKDKVYDLDYWCPELKKWEEHDSRNIIAWQYLPEPPKEEL